MSEKQLKGQKKKKLEATPLFGVPIEDAALRSDLVYRAVPSPIRRAVEYLNQRGLKEEGLYRVPGNAQKFADYRRQFDEGEQVDFVAADERSPENVAMVIIKYLQMLPDPLLTRKWEQHFKVALGIDSNDPKERYHVIRAILMRLPFANRETIRVLALHLKKVAQCSDINKMTARNIELTWSLSVGAIVGAVMRVLVEIESPPPSSILFGVPFLDSCRNTEVAERIGPFFVPAPIFRAWEWFKTTQSWSDDVFTKFSSSDLPARMRADFNEGMHVIPAEATPIDVATFVRDFIVEMPDSIFSDKLHDDFGAVADIPHPAEQVRRLRELFSQLAPAFRHTLKSVTLFLSDVLAHSTKMSSFSIAFAFQDRYVDKIPLLLDNAKELFDGENDVTQLPWFDVTKASSQAGVPLMSFSIGASPSESETQDNPEAQEGLKKLHKPEKRSRHAVDSPSERNVTSKKSSKKLKRVKSEAELSESRVRSPKRLVVATAEGDSTPTRPKKRTHTKIKSEDVRSSSIDSNKKQKEIDASNGSGSATKRTSKRRAGSDSTKITGDQTETALPQAADEFASATSLPQTPDDSAVQQRENNQERLKNKEKKKSKRGSDKQIVQSEGSHEETTVPSKPSSRKGDRKKSDKEHTLDDLDSRKPKSSKKHMKTM